MLKEAKEAIENQYNYSISVYEYSDHIRFTNGSAAMYINIEYKDNTFYLSGERYGETIKKTCNGTVEDLLNTLSSTV